MSENINSQEVIAELRNTVAELNGRIDALNSEHRREIAALKLDHAVERELAAAGAKSVKAAKALIELPEGLSVAEDGSVEGIREAVEKIKRSDPFLFSGGSAVDIKGVLPAESGADMPDFSKMTYSQVSDFLANNPGFGLGLGDIL